MSLARRFRCLVVIARFNDAIKRLLKRHLSLGIYIYFINLARIPIEHRASLKLVLILKILKKSKVSISEKCSNPSLKTIAPDHVWREMEEGAVRLAKIVGYRSTGTVEYLYNPADQSFCFLELNPRLQVEHPCTEMITDVNLPAAQLCIGMGIQLAQLQLLAPFYGGCVDLTKEAKPRGHVIACRITSENPDAGFQPGSGTVQELNFRSSKNVWGYFSVAAFGSLHEFADSQFGHIFAWGETREQAMSYLGMALRELSIRGDFRTIVEYLTHLIETDKFRTSNFTTGWLDQLIRERDAPKEPDTRISSIAAALHIADRQWATQRAQYRQALERGQVLPLEALAQSVIQLSLVHKGRVIRLKVMRPGANEFTIELNQSTLNMEIVRLSDGGILVQLAGVSHCSYFQESLTDYRVTVNNQTAVFEKDNDPSVLRAPSAGKLIGYVVDDGAPIKVGDVYAELEVMKMIMQVKVAHAGTLIHEKKPGSLLTQGACVARLELTDETAQVKLEPFDGDFSDLIEPKSSTGSPPSSVESEERIASTTTTAAGLGGHKRNGSFSGRGIGGRTGSFTQTTLGQLATDASLPFNQHDQPHIMLKRSLSRIDAILKGYTLSPTEQMKSRINKTLASLFLACRNRALPLLEMKEVN